MADQPESGEALSNDETAVRRIEEENWTTQAVLRAARVGVPLPLLLSGLALAAVLVGNGLSNALPGVFSGIDAQISQLQQISAYLSQLCALVFAVFSVRMGLQAVLGSAPLVLRVLGATAVSASAGVVYFSISAAQRPANVLLAVMALLVATLGFAVGSTVLRHRELRASGLLLMTAMGAGVLHLGARWLAISASAQPSAEMYRNAEWLATLGLCFEIGVVLLAFGWLGFTETSRVRRLNAWLGIVVASALAWAAMSSDGWRLLLGRTLTALGAHPDPLLPVVLRHFMELSALWVCVLCLLPNARPKNQRLLLVLALLARSRLDVPIGALFGLCAGLTLLGLLSSATSAEQARRNRQHS